MLWKKSIGKAVQILGLQLIRDVGTDKLSTSMPDF